MLRGFEHDDGGAPQGPRDGCEDSTYPSVRSADHGPVWRRCYEFAVVASRLRRLEATEIVSDPDLDESLGSLWRERAELAEGIVDAAASTIQDVILKMAMTSSLLSEGALRVGLTTQSLEECDRALSEDGDSEQCLKALEPSLWALRQRVQEQIAQLDDQWDCHDRREDDQGDDDLCASYSLESAWEDLHDSVWSVARYEAATAVGLRAKGKMFRDLLAFLSAMDGLFALQVSYMRDFDHLANIRLHGENSLMLRCSVG